VTNRAVAALLIPVLLAFVGCEREQQVGAPSTPSSDQFESSIDPDSGAIVLPLDAFSFSEQEFNEVALANYRSVGICMEAQGFPYPRAAVTIADFSSREDRRYGIWVSTKASKFGYHLPPNPVMDLIVEEENSFPDEWFDGARECLTSPDVLPLSLGYEEPTIVDIGFAAAREEAVGDSRWAIVRSDWTRCIEEEGLTADPDPRFLIPVEVPEDVDGQIRIALIDVRCKESTDAIARLVAIESERQREFANEHLTELMAFRSEVDAVVELAREILVAD
jgi:hypothetical protein